MENITNYVTEQFSSSGKAVLTKQMGDRYMLTIFKNIGTLQLEIAIGDKDFTVSDVLRDLKSVCREIIYDSVNEITSDDIYDLIRVLYDIKSRQIEYDISGDKFNTLAKGLLLQTLRIKFANKIIDGNYIFYSEIK